jgi:hypothetical protein
MELERDSKMHSSIAVMNSHGFLSWQRLLTDSSPRLREALRYTIYGRTGVFDADRFIDVMEAFETFTTSARSGGGDKMQGSMASLGLVSVRTPAQLPAPLVSSQQLEQGVQMRTALAFIVSDQGQFFREFILDEVCIYRCVCVYLEIGVCVFWSVIWQLGKQMLCLEGLEDIVARLEIRS